MERLCKSKITVRLSPIIASAFCAVAIGVIHRWSAGLHIGERRRLQKSLYESVSERSHELAMRRF
jgi:hypothetical protein